MQTGGGKRVKRILVIGLCVVAALWMIGNAVMYLEMRRPPESLQVS
jgi:hypothetical protein